MDRFLCSIISQYIDIHLRSKPIQTLVPKKINFKENLSALQFVPLFFKKVKNVSPSLFYLNIALRIIDAIIPVAQLWVAKQIIDQIVEQIGSGDKSLDKVLLLVALEFGLAILSDIMNRIINLCDGLLGDKYSNASSVEIIKKTAELNLEQLEDPTFYDKLERARQQTSNRVSLLSNILAQFQDIIVISSLLVGVVLFEPWLLLLLIFSILPTIINEIKFSGTSYSLSRSWTQERRELDYLRYAGASDVTAKEVKLFGLSGYLAKRFEELADKYFNASKKLAIQRSFWGSSFNILGTSAYYVAYLLIIFRTISGILSIGDLSFLSGSFNRLRSKLQGFFIRFTSITESSMYLQDYFEFLALTNSDPPADQLVQVPKKILKGFEFRNVGFKYPNTERWVVRNLNFNIGAGEKMAFVGENGAGKTTLIKLLLRYYDPTEGTILLDDVDIKCFDRTSYQQYFGVIFQDFVKFELTLRENIAVGKIEALSDDIVIAEASEKSLADQVIQIVPNGMEQQLGRRFRNGVELSGGQWQKIALARAYMKDAEVLILDEPTSALDARAEFEAFKRFIALTVGKTAVIISHRFSTVRMADRIIVLKDGALLEQGSHDDLLSKNGLYAELFNLQAEGYQ